MGSTTGAYDQAREGTILTDESVSLLPNQRPVLNQINRLEAAFNPEAEGRLPAHPEALVG
jgi:hypothetical protein